MLVCAVGLRRSLGRKYSLFIGMMGVAAMGACQAVSTNIVYLIVFIGILGICVGASVPFISVYLAEISPIKNRGRYFLILCNSNPLGLLIMVVVSYLILKDIDAGNWQYLMFFISGFALLSLTLAFFNFFESPRYLAINNKVDDCVAVLQLMAKKNNRPEISLEDKLQLDEWGKKEYERTKHLKASVKQLFVKDKIGITIKLGLMWLSLAFVYYGIIFQLPELLKKVNKQKQYQDKLEYFLDLGSQAVTEFPAIFLSAWIIEKKYSGRKISLLVCYLVMASFSGLILITQEWGLIIFINVIKFFSSAAFYLIFTFTAEIYDTMLRATGCGFQNVICRVSAASMPFIIQLTFKLGTFGPFWAFLAVSTLSAIGTFLLPKDTTSAALDTYFIKDPLPQDHAPDKAEQDQEDIAPSKASEKKLLVENENL